MKKSGSALKECAVKHALSHTPALRKNSSGKRDTDKGMGRNSLISSFPDDRIARKPERNRNFTRDRSRSFNLPETFFLSFFSLSFFMRITHRSRIDIFLEILRLICLHLLRVSRTFRKLCDSRFFGPERKSFDEVFDYSDYSRKKEIFLQFHARCISSE